MSNFDEGQKMVDKVLEEAYKVQEPSTPEEVIQQKYELNKKLYNALQSAWKKVSCFNTLPPAKQKPFTDMLNELEKGSPNIDALYQFIEATFKESEIKRIYKISQDKLESDEAKRIKEEEKQREILGQKIANERKEKQLDGQINHDKERDEWLDSTTDTQSVVIFLIAEKKRSKATEAMVKDFLDHNSIYTTRDDEKSECWIYHEGIYIPQGRTYIKEYCRNILGKLYTNTLCNEVINKIEADTYIEQEEFFKDEPPNLIAVKNGIFDLDNKELKDFSPDYIFFSKMGIDYTPGQDCPMIKKFFESLFKDRDEINVIQEVFGFLLYREYFLEKAFMCLGGGRNGKGKTLELMKHFIGVENCAEINLESMEKDIYSIGELFKKNANLCGDLSKTALKHTGEFKKLTGRDLLSAARKFKTRVQFVNYAKMIFSCNELPISYDITEAFFNRWIILDFPFTFLPEQELNEIEDKENYKLRDPNIITRISTDEEMQGLLNWAIEGLDRLRKEQCFSYSPSTNDTRNKWLRRSDSCMAFVMDYVEYDYESVIVKSEFKNRYVEYCKRHKVVISNDKTIKHILNTTMGAYDNQRKNVEGSQEHVWSGIRFKFENKEKEKEVEQQQLVKTENTKTQDIVCEENITQDIVVEEKVEC